MIVIILPESYSVIFSIENKFKMTFGKTGDKCMVSGKYRCFGNRGKLIHVKEGEAFPDETDSPVVFWILLHKTEDHKKDNSAEPNGKKV